MDNTLVTLLVLGVVALVALLAIFFGLPALLYLGATVEAFSVLAEGIDEYFNRPGLARVCCITSFLMIAGCCLVVIVAAIIGLQCFAESPPGICRLIGR